MFNGNQITCLFKKQRYFTHVSSMTSFLQHCWKSCFTAHMSNFVGEPHYLFLIFFFSILCFVNIDGIKII